MSSQKALETIGANLMKQFEWWQPRARYKLSLDPCAEEVKKLCTQLRRNAKVSAHKYWLFIESETTVVSVLG